MRPSVRIRATGAFTALAALAPVGLAACGETNTLDPSAAEPPSESDGRRGSAEPSDPPRDRPRRPLGERPLFPPDVRVRYGAESVDLPAWTTCFGSMCADGMPPENPHDVGSPPQVVVEFPLEGWRFKASFKASGHDCARIFPAELDEIDPGRFVLRPAGYAGEYDVTLSGRGPEGDLYVTFNWTTPTDGPLPTPSAYASIIDDHDGRLTSESVEMAVSQLAAEPGRVDAEITVTAADGDSLTFSPRLGRHCPGDGTLRWDDPDGEGDEAANLGPAPFRYDVRLVLDGQTYRAHATWPDDVHPILYPQVRLDFTPDLPALR